MERTQALAQCVQLTHLALSTVEGERDNALAHIRRLRQEHDLTNAEIGRALDIVEKTQGPKTDQIDFGDFADAFRARGNSVYYNDIKPRIKAFSAELQVIEKEVKGLPLEAQVRALAQLYVDVHYMAEGTGRNASGFVAFINLKSERDTAIRLHMKALWDKYRAELTESGIQVRTGQDERYRPIFETDHTPELIELMSWFHARDEVVKHSDLTKSQVMSIVGNQESYLQKKLADATRKEEAR